MRTCFHRLTSIAIAIRMLQDPVLVAAGVIQVTTPSDSGPGSLREAVLQLNAEQIGTIDATGLHGTIQLLTPLPLISAHGAIFGPGPGLLSIDGAYKSQLLRYAPGVTQILSGFSLVHGHGKLNESGSAIQNEGSLTVSNCVFLNNYTMGGFGGAVWSRGDLVFDRCQFLTNWAYGVPGYSDSCPPDCFSLAPASGGSSAGMGGAVFVEDGDVTLRNSTLFGNGVQGGSGGLYCADPPSPEEPVCVPGRGGGPDGGDMPSHNNPAPRPAGFGSGGGSQRDGGFGGGGGGSGGKGGYGAGDGDISFWIQLRIIPGSGGGGGGFGGAMFVKEGNTVVSNCQFVANHALGGESRIPGAGFGGGLFVHDGLVHITHSTFASNLVSSSSSKISYDPPGLFTRTAAGSGAAIHIHGGQVGINSSSIVSNIAISTFASRAYGSGIGIDGGETRIENSTLSRNQIRGKRGNSPALMVEVYGDAPGAADGGALSITNGAVFLSHTTIASNVCFAGNIASGFCELSDCAQLTNPIGAAGIHQAGGSLRLTSCLIAGNGGYDGVPSDDQDKPLVGIMPRPYRPHDGSGRIDSLGYNLIQSAGQLSGSIDTDLTGVAPRLGPLSFNGGRTLCHALLQGSYGVNSADPTSELKIDQRGAGRPQNQFPDMGSYEREGDSTEFSPIAESGLTLMAIPYGTEVVLQGNLWSFTPMQFQWFRNGVAIHGATNESLQLPFLSLVLEGDYVLRATNRVGSGASAITRVSVGTHRPTELLQWQNVGRHDTSAPDAFGSYEFDALNFNGQAGTIQTLLPAPYTLDTEQNSDGGTATSGWTLRNYLLNGSMLWKTHLTSDEDFWHGARLIRGGSPTINVITHHRREVIGSPLGFVFDLRMNRFSPGSDLLEAVDFLAFSPEFLNPSFLGTLDGGLLSLALLRKTDGNLSGGIDKLNAEFKGEWNYYSNAVESISLAFTNQVLFVGRPTRPTPSSLDIPGSVTHQVGLLDNRGRLKWRLDVVGANDTAVRCASAGNFAFLQILSTLRVIAVGTTILDSSEYRAHYLIRLGPNAEIIWARQFRDSAYELMPMAADESGNCYVSIAGQVLQLDSPGLGHFQPSASEGGYNLGFAKYSSSGELRWYTSFCRQNSPRIRSIVADGSGGCLFLEFLTSQSADVIGCQPFIHPPAEPASRYALLGRLGASPQLMIRREGLAEEVLVSIIGEPGRISTLETSSDLSNWVVLDHMTFPRGVGERTVMLDSNNQAIFYRAVFADSP